MLIAIVTFAAAVAASEPATATGVTPPSPEAQAAFERGRRLYELGDDLPGARKALDDALALAPAYAKAYLYRALVTAHDHGVGGARADFEYAIALAPDDKEAHRHFGEALLDAGELVAAEKHLARAIELDPDYAEPVYYLAKLRRKQGRVDDAIALFERHATLAPKGTAHHVLGEIFLEKGDDARAAKEFELDLATDPSCQDSRVNLAGLYLESRAYKAAREQYELSLEYHPGDARALSGLGRAYLALGDYERAIGALRAAQDRSPDDHDVKDALATARRKLRIRYGLPFALVPSAIALGLVAYIFARGRKKTSDLERGRRSEGAEQP